MIQHGRQHSARTACGSCDNNTSRGVFFAHGQCVAVNKASGLEVALIARCLYVVCACFSREVKRPWQSSFCVYAALHGFLHRFPHLHQVFPYFRSFGEVHIFPIVSAVVVTPFHYLRHGAHAVNVSWFVAVVGLSFRESTAAYAVYGPVFECLPFCVFRDEAHAVGVEGKKYCRFPQ